MSVNLFLLSVLAYVVIFFYWMVDRKLNDDIFSAVKVFCMFSCLSTFPLVWYSLSSTAIDNYIFTEVTAMYQDRELVLFSYLSTLLILVVTGFGILLGSYYNGSFIPFVLDKLYALRLIDIYEKAKGQKSYVFAIFLMIFGFLFYFIYVYKMGGINNIWANLLNRADMSAGLMYFQKFYFFAMSLGSLILIAYYLRRKKFFLAIATVVLVVAIFGSLNQRGPAAVYLFNVLLVYHFTYKRIKSIFRLKYVSLVLVLLVFLSSFAEIRLNGPDKYMDEPSLLLDDMANNFEKQVIARFGRLERDIVILGYFNEHDFWYGSSYYSVVTAPIPRNILVDKAPVDTGRYLGAMAFGHEITPPVATIDLPYSYSWPEGNWAGYMNFGYLGLFGLCVLSGFIFGAMYRYARVSGFVLGPVIFFSMHTFNAPFVLSPLGLVDILIYSVFLFVCTFIFRIRLKGG